MSHIETLGQLRDTLVEHDIDVTKYGQGTAKTLNQLLKEIKDGETILEVKDGQLKRTVNVLFISIVNSEGKVLKEIQQLFHATPERGEYTRKRNIVLGEKVLPGESVDDAVKRAVLEELGLNISQKNYNSDVERESTEKYSASYPELLCVYNYVYVKLDAQETGLDIIPDEYSHTEYLENGEPRVTSTWMWM